MVLVATQVKRRRGTTAENDAFTGAEGEITVDTEKHELRVHDGVKQGGFKIGGGSGSGRNIGDTFMTKRTDTSLAGAVECDGATYNTTDFTGNGSIGELLEAGKLDYVSLSAYSTAIAQTGWCDKIGWDGTGTTSFRVPTITPGHYIIKSQEPTAENNYTWYRLYADGWVEQGGLALNIPWNRDGGEVTVSLPITMRDTNYTAMATLNNSALNWNCPGCRILKYTSGVTVGLATLYDSQGTGNCSWEVKGKSSITPQTNTRVMIQISNGATDEALETCTGVLADVAGLKDMSNITATGKEVCANLAMPSTRYIDLTLGASGATYTAPADGYVLFVVNLGTFISISADQLRVFSPGVGTDGQWYSVFCPVRKNKTFVVSYGGSIVKQFFRFVYAEGAQ